MLGGLGLWPVTVLAGMEVGADMGDIIRRG